VKVIGPGTSSIHFIAWLPDSRRLAPRERVFDRSRQEWWIYDRVTGCRTALWPARASSPDLLTLDMLAWSPNGGRVASVVREVAGSTVWVMDSSGEDAEEVATGTRLSFAAWSPEGCLGFEDGSQHLRLPCGSPDPLFADQEVYGRVAFSPDGPDVYYAAPGPGSSSPAIDETRAESDRLTSS
jgi:hypothetical protein